MCIRDRRQEAPELPPELIEKVKVALPKEVPLKVVCPLIQYYLANRPDDSAWVVLPVTNFDAYFGDTSFSKKYLQMCIRDSLSATHNTAESRQYPALLTGNNQLF